jgi:3-deoxy-D-manno-octulosonic-acid transferase
LYTLYSMIIGLGFYLLLPFALLYVWLSGRHREGLTERLGLYRAIPRITGRPRIWLHAASVGEVQAARAIMTELHRLLPKAEFILTTMTLHGRKVAHNQLRGEAACLLAPLDVPGIVTRVLDKLAPDVYVCIETELWPLLLHAAARRGVRVVQVNGRLSAGSVAGYKKTGLFFRKVLANFSAMAVISEADRERYLQLGAVDGRLQVAGNVKYDLRLPAEPELVRQRLRQILGIDDETEVLVAGSTHTGEEELLLPLLPRLGVDRPFLLLVAPRHLQRLGGLQEMLYGKGIGFHLFSELAATGRRRHSLVLIDSLGELAEIYSVATYVFCGGSLVERNGHNIMEAAIWGRAVLYGPSMADFQDAVLLLESVGAGIMVKDAAELAGRIEGFRSDPQAYRQACLRAGEIARKQQGAAVKQAKMIVDCLAT